RVLALHSDAKSGVLFAGTDNGVFRTSDGGSTWQATSAGLPNTRVLALHSDAKSGVLFVATKTGIFRSTDGGGTWQVASAGLINTDVNTLRSDANSGALFAGTAGGAFRSTDGGGTWQVASAGLTDRRVLALHSDAKSGDLFAGTSGGVFRSTDGGNTWQAASAGLTDLYVNILHSNTKSGVLFTGTFDGVFRSTDGGSTWQAVSLMMTLLGDFWLDSSPALLGHTRFAQRILLLQSADPLWIWLAQWANFETPQVAIDPHTNEWVVRQPWGAQITTHAFSSQQTQLGSWVKLRLLAWGLSKRLAPYQTQILLGLLAFLIYSLVSRYVRAGWPFGVSPLALLWPWRWPQLANPSKLNAANMHWQSTIQSELLAWGDVKPYDLLAVPQPYRNYALQTYATKHANAAQLDYVAHQQHLRLQNPDAMQAWQHHWQVAIAQASPQGGLMPTGWEHVSQLQTQLGQALRFQTLGPINDTLAQGIVVEARHLPIGVPSRFPLLFVAQPNPTPDTVQSLLSLVLPTFAGDSGNLFGLCVLLAPPDTAEQSAVQLRRLINESLQKPNLAVLSYDDTINIMLARDAAKALAILIASQRDLSLISPFKPKSAVAESMFLGREQETRQVVSGIEQGSYAIIGNRRIGKTSLLRNIERQLGAKAQQILPIYIDAQAAKDTADIIRILKRGDIVLRDNSLAAVEEAFYAQKQTGRLPVMLIDEADALFIADRHTGEQLGQRFRAWSQAGLCRFVFCGSGGLARLMADPESGFFNFAQQLTLGYLTPEHARELLRRPLEHLGVDLVEANTLLSKVVELTSGHPSIVQLTGKYLVDETINKRLDRRVVPDDIDDLYHNSEFAKAYLETVLGEIRLRQYALEYAIVLVAPDEQFDYRGLQNALQQAGIAVEGEAVLKALDNLVMFSLLSKQGRVYQFVPTAFRRILNEHNEVDVILNGIKRNLTPQATSSASPSSTPSAWTISDIADL
nr:AAA family ATPase [Anaerolineae bacterium]